MLKLNHQNLGEILVKNERNVQNSNFNEISKLWRKIFEEIPIFEEITILEKNHNFGHKSQFGLKS